MTFVEQLKAAKQSPRGDSARVDPWDGHKTVMSPYFQWKGTLERVLAIILLVPGIPIMLMLAILVRLTSRGPAIYRQLRTGKDGRPFMMYKIRTMRHDAEVEKGPQWTEKNDPRITRLGRNLRKLHLDELPQLFNVVKGEMNLIGPRPERPEFIRVLASEMPHYLDRLMVLPGITGLAQINLPPDTDVDSVRRKLVLDLEYVREANFFLDLRMFICTSLRFFNIPGDSAMWLMRLQRCVHLEHESASRPAAINGNGQAGPLVASNSGAKPSRNGNHTVNGSHHRNGSAESASHDGDRLQVK